MIHFDFIVDDIDAENIMDAIHSEICRLREEAIQCGEFLPKEKSEHHKKFLLDRADYLEKLKGKMKNESV